MIEWYTNNQTRCRYDSKTGNLFIPAELIDKDQVLGNTVKVNIGIDRENNRLIIKYTKNHFKGLNLKRPNNPASGTQFKMSLTFLPNCDKILAHGYYNIRVKEDELEIDLSKVYKTKY